MNKALKVGIAWISIWLFGCVIFDMWLKLTGGWLMLSGVVTYYTCARVCDAMLAERDNGYR